MSRLAKHWITAPAGFEYYEKQHDFAGKILAIILSACQTRPKA
jgi:hypothetical protein